MSKETEQTTGKGQDNGFNDFLRDYVKRRAGEKVGKVTMAMLRKAMRELGLPASDTAEGAKQLAAKTAKALSEGFDDYRKASASMDALMEKQYLNEAEKQRQKQDAIMGKLHRLQFIHDALQRIEAKQPTEVFWNKKVFAMFSMSIDKDADGVEMSHGGFSYYPWEALQLEAFKEILPELKKARTFLYTDEVTDLAKAVGKKPRRVEAKGGLLSASKQPSGLYYDTPSGSYIFPFHVCNGEMLDPRLYPVFALILSRFHDLNKSKIERPAKHRQQTESGDLKRKVELSWADLSKYLPFSPSKYGQARARDVVRNAAIMLIYMKVGRDMEDGSYRVTNMFEETESNCGKKKLIATLSESFAVKLARVGKWLKFYDDVLTLPPEHAAAFLFAHAKPLPLDGSRWRTSELSEIVQCLGIDEGGEIHNSLHDDVLQKMHGFIESVEQAGLARCRIMRRMEDGGIAELTEKQANFIEGEKRCNVRHDWKDLAGLVLQVELLDPLDADEKSIEEDDKRAIEARRRKLKEEAAS